MIKTDRVELSKSINLISEENPSYTGILLGESSGEIWVDNINNPTLALIYSYSVEGYAIMGTPKDDKTLLDLFNFLNNSIIPQSEYFEFSIESYQVKDKLLKMFSNRTINSEAEYYFRAKNRVEQTSKLPDDYEIVFVDKSLLNKIETGEIQNREMLEKRILESWSSYSNFFTKSIAYVIIYKKRIEAVIVGTARYKNIIPIDIETNESHQKKGLASVLTENFINKCIEKNLIAQWNCIESNIASKKTAEKAGFKLLKKDYYHWFE